ncbi:hypothetical protein ACAF76_004370 [Brevibacillus sp. TJ4]|uniref:hypothetical protein n=1 Tax=Brevibacillus sp. TJ4 TaxID=3234853 RepID=UPI0037D99063
MKYHLTAMIFLLILSLGSIVYTVAYERVDAPPTPEPIQHSEDYQKGLQFARTYHSAYANYLAADPAVDEEFVKKVAFYKAYSELYSMKLTEEQAIEKLRERKLLAEYAKENDLYPSEEEIRAYIQIVADTFLHVSYDLKEGVKAGLGITEKQFFFDFQRDQYEEALVRTKIVENLKRTNQKREDESDNQYHNRMLNELDNLLVALKAESQ